MFQGEIVEKESRAHAQIDELSRRLAEETVTSEQKTADIAALQSKLLIVESQLTEHVQSQSRIISMN